MAVYIVCIGRCIESPKVAKSLHSLTMMIADINALMLLVERLEGHRACEIHASGSPVATWSSSRKESPLNVKQKQSCTSSLY